MANGNFLDNLGGLLAQGNPLFDVGLGLLSAAGPSTQQVSLGQALGSAAQFAGSRGRARLENSVTRQKLLGRRAIAELIESLGGAPAPGGVGLQPSAGVGFRPSRVGLQPQNLQPDAFQPRQGLLSPQQQALLKVAAQVDPSTALKLTGGLLFPETETRRENSLIAQAQFAFPDDPEKQRQFVAENVRAKGGTSEQLDQILKTMQIQALQAERGKARTEKERETVERRQSVFNAFDQIDNLIRINARLRNTAGETGLGFGELRRTASGPFTVLVGLFGGDEQKARQVASDFQLFSQQTTDVALRSLGEAGGGVLTNQRLSTILTTKPGNEQLPEVNDAIFADMLKATLDRSAQFGLDVPDRKAREAQIKRLRGAPAAARTERPSGAPDSPPAGVDPALWSVMTEEEKALWRR